jgi:hypothetical protein
MLLLLPLFSEANVLSFSQLTTSLRRKSASVLRRC